MHIATRPAARAIPGYAVDLLMAAKLVAHPPINATPEMLAGYQQILAAAVAAFEAAMPTQSGLILESR